MVGFWLDRKLTDFERIVLENQHSMLYFMRNTSPNDIVYRTMQDQMIKCRAILDNDDRRE